MNILHAAGFKIGKAQRDLADWYVVAVKYNSSIYGVISVPLSLEEVLLEHGMVGQVILKFPQGYENPAVEYTQWNTAGSWRVPILISVGVGVNFFNSIGFPAVGGMTLNNCNLIESGFNQRDVKGTASQDVVISFGQGYWYKRGTGWLNYVTGALSGNIQFPAFGNGVRVDSTISFTWFL